MTRVARGHGPRVRSLAPACASVLIATLVLVACGTRVSPDEQGERTAGQSSSLEDSLGQGDLGSGAATAPGADDQAGAAPPGTGPADGGGSSVPGGAPPGAGGAPPSGQPTAPGSGPGEPVTGPIRVGILGTKDTSEAAAQIGANNGNTTTPTAAFKALIAGLNESGGMAGRRVETVLAEIDPNSVNYAGEYEAACATFTEDNHVELVVSVAGGPVSMAFERCLGNAGVVHVDAGYGTSGESEMDSIPTWFNADSPTVDRRMNGTLSTLAAAGLLKSGSKLGVVVEGCSHNVRAYENAVVPAAQAAGVSLERFDTKCIAGFSDAGNASADMGSAGFRFRTAGVSTVTFVSGFEATLALFFANAAESQQWRPGYALTSAGALTVLGNGTNAPASQVVNMSAGGWLPQLDDSRAALSSTAERRCLTLAKQGGVQPRSRTDETYLVSACDAVFLAEAGLRAAGGRSDAASLTAALQGLRGRVRLPGLISDRTYFGPDRHDGATLFQAVSYNSSCRCFRPSAAPRTVN